MVPFKSSPPPALCQFKIHATGLELFWEDGLRNKVSYWWLRDHDPEFIHANGQKLSTTQDWPDQLLPDEVSQEDNGLRLVWAGDHHTSVITGDILWQHAIEVGKESGRIIWNRMLQPEICFFELSHIMTDRRSRLEWLETIQSYGFAGLSGLKGSSEELEEVISLIGPIRETNFGRIYDIKPQVNPANLSDTHLALPPRTENPYRDPAPGLHAMLCLSPAARGGETILVDGAFALSKVKKHNPLGYQMLSEVPVRFQYRDEKVWLEHERCLVEHKPDGSLQSLAFNNRSVDPFSFPAAQQESWYKAYRFLERELLSTQNQLRISLRAGQLLIVNNRRVLHGQTTFFAKSPRHLLGCYLEKDGLDSAVRTLAESLKKKVW